MIERILNLLPHDVIHVGGKPYMKRWYVLGYAPGDPDASFDRKSNARTGRWCGYSGRHHTAPWVIRRRARDLHALEVPPGEQVWTLFITGRKQRTWGFSTADGWVGWREFDQRNPEQVA